MEQASKASEKKRSAAKHVNGASERSERPSGPFKTPLSRVETGSKGNASLCNEQTSRDQSIDYEMCSKKYLIQKQH